MTPVSVLQIRAVPSKLAVTMRRPLRSRSTCLITPLCPTSVKRSAPVLESHARAVWSRLAVTTS